MADAVEIYYADNPWGTISMLERAPVYVPNLLAAYKKYSKYGRFVTVQGDFGALRTRQIVLTRHILSDPDFSPKSTRQLFRASSSVGGFARKTIDLEYHADEIHWYKDDDLFNYLDTSVETLSRTGMGYLMTLYLDTLYRNAALTSKFKQVIGHGAYEVGANDFSDLVNADLFSLSIVPKLQLGFQNDELVDPEGGPVRLAIIASPGQIFDVSEKAGVEWKSINTYTSEGRAALLQYGIVGVYKGAAFIPSNQNILWNCGVLTAQAAIVEPVNTQDGAAVGADGWDPQQSGAKAYIQLDTNAWDAGAITDLAQGDVVTLHRTRGNTNGVANGVDYTEGTAETRTVLSVDPTNKRVSFTKPVFKRSFETALAGGQYGWLTKARHVHAAIAMAASDAIMVGVAQPPTIAEGVPLDTMQKQRRIGWDAWLKAHLMNHEPVRVFFSTGSTVIEGFENIL